ncbi:MAG: PAS domain-containing sensor histidine kinase [Methanoregulaceae archaeon]
MISDMQSLTLIFFLVTWFVALMLFIYWKTQKTYDGFSHWTWGSVLLPSGFLLITLSASFLSEILLVVSYIPIILSAMMRLDGTSRFIRSKPLPLFWYGILIPVFPILLYFTYIQDSFTARTLIQFVVITPLLFIIGIIALRSEKRENRIINYCFAATVILCGILEIIRSVQWILNGPPSYGSVDNFTNIVFVSALLLDILATGFFLMLNLVRARRDLTASEERFRSLVETTSDFIWEVDAAGVYTYASPKVYDHLGYRPEELIGRTPFDLMPPGEAQRIRGEFTRLAHSKLPIHSLENLCLHKSGVPVILETSGVPWLAGDGSLIGYRGIDRDITGRKKAEEALRESKAQLALAIEGSGVGFWDWDIETGVVRVNERWAEIAGYTLSEITPVTIDTWNAFCHPDDRLRSEELLRKHFSKETPRYECEARVRRKDGQWVWILDRGKVVEWDPNGRPIRMTGTHLDITERKQVEEALRTVNKKLNLLSGITRHDIRNQLTVLGSCLDLSEETIDNPAELRKLLKKEQDAADAIGRQINFTRDYEDLGVHSPVWQNVHMLARNAAAALPMGSVGLDIGCPGLEVFADPLLEKVFYNLIDNSLRYGGDALTGISVTAGNSGEDLRIIFEDDGTGISPGDKKQLFTKGFGRHTGLGLFLSRDILSITGIMITETGEPGRGARFEIVVPKGAYRIAATDRAAG